jgi:hypothetical protein
MYLKSEDVKPAGLAPPAGGTTSGNCDALVGVNGDNPSENVEKEAKSRLTSLSLETIFDGRGYLSLEPMFDGRGYLSLESIFEGRR